MIKIEEKSRFYKALGEPIRLKIIEHLLNKKDCCICELQKSIKRDQSVIFRHVQLLKEAGIVSTRKEVNFLMCCLNDKKKIKKFLEG